MRLAKIRNNKKIVRGRSEIPGWMVESKKISKIIGFTYLGLPIKIFYVDRRKFPDSLCKPSRRG